MWHADRALLHALRCRTVEAIAELDAVRAADPDGTRAAATAARVGRGLETSVRSRCDDHRVGRQRRLADRQHLHVIAIRRGVSNAVRPGDDARSGAVEVVVVRDAVEDAVTAGCDDDRIRGGGGRADRDDLNVVS